MHFFAGAAGKLRCTRCNPAGAAIGQPVVQHSGNRGLEITGRQQGQHDRHGHRSQPVEIEVNDAERFDDAVIDQLSRDPHDVLKVAGHPDYALAVPTPDHFIPLLYTAGAAGGDAVEPLVRGYAMGSISMTCYGAGAGAVPAEEPCCAAGLPEGVPPDQTNM